MTDSEIVEELKKGNTTVLKFCYQHLSMIESFVVKNSGTVQDSHDIFQDALIIFYKNAIKPDFELSSKISTFLFGICRRLWLQQLRKKSKLLIESDEQTDELAVVEHFDFELAEVKSSQLKIVDVVSQMAEPCKSILNWFYFKKLSLREIAERLDYNSEQVARQQKYRCLKSIKGRVKALKMTAEELSE